MPPITFFIEQFTSIPKAPEGDLLKGKNVIITGANTGLGLELAQKYARMSPKKLIMTARNMKAGTEALEQVLKATPGVPIDLWELDLAKYSSIKAFAKRAETELGTVDLLMNNAGVNLGPLPKDADITEDGHELSFQTNAIAPVLMLFALLPCLEKSASPSVIFTTSEVHAWTDGAGVAKAAQNSGGVIKGMDSVSPLVGFPRYMESKMMLQTSIRNLIQALPNIRMIAVNPGLCKTSFGRHFGRSWANLQDISGMVTNMIIARQPEVGARNLVHAAVGDFESCEYFTCAEPGFSPSTFLPKATGLAVAKQYWGELMAEVEKVFPGRTESLKKIYA